MADTNYKLEGYTGADIQSLLNFLASHKDYITYGRPFSDNNRDGVIAVDVPHVYLDNVTIAGSYMFWSGVTLHDGPNGDVSWGPTGLIVEVINKYDGVPSGQVATLKQTIFKVTTTEKNIYVRFRTAADTWTTWQQVLTSGDIDDSLSTSGKIADAGAVGDLIDANLLKTVKHIIPNIEPTTGSINDLTETGFYHLTTGATYDKQPWPAGTRRLIITYAYSKSYIAQTAFNIGTGEVKARYLNATTWTDWTKTLLVDETMKKLVADIEPTTGSINELTKTGFYHLAANTNYKDQPWPSRSRRLVIVYGYSQSFIIQIAFKANTGEMKSRFYNGVTWTDWCGTGNSDSLNRNDLLYSLFLPIKSNRYVYGKGKWWGDASNIDWNTVDSYTAAAQESDCWGISGDVQWCATAGKYVMYHNETVTYNNETRYVNDLTLTELQSITLPNGGSIPTLEEFVDVCRKYGKVCFVETKRGPVSGETGAHNNQWSKAAVGHETDFKNVVDYIVSKGMTNSTLFVIAGDDVSYMISNYSDIGVVSFSDSSPSAAFKQKIIDNPQLVAMVHYPEITTDFIEEMHSNKRMCMTWASRPTQTSTVQSMVNLDCDAVLIYCDPPALL